MTDAYGIIVEPQHPGGERRGRPAGGKEDTGDTEGGSTEAGGPGGRSPVCR